MLVEVCVNSLQSALNAEEAGADRLELCMELGVGGVTPSYGLLKKVKEEIAIPVHVLIRPRSGDFNYSDLEFQIMRRNIALCSDLGFEGVVSGILTEDYKVDKERTSILVEESKEMHFTFHRAFDWVDDALEELQVLEALKVDCILSSGKQKKAIDGIELLQNLKRTAKQCIIMPGAGITIDNVMNFKEAGFSVVHLSGVKIKESEIPTTKVSMFTNSFLKDTVALETNLHRVQSIVSKVK